MLCPDVTLKGDVLFEKVHFHYPNREDVTVLNDINLRIAPGERVALVGASGAGKSTIASLLLRFHDPVTGKVSIDGKPLKAFPLSSLRKRMAFVPQEVILFGGDIRTNIAYGRFDATDTEIEEAARKANAYDFIQSFPEGLDTLVGERGVQLSGGQRQRVAVARALVNRPDLLLADEPTGNLDTKTSIEIMALFEEIHAAGNTVIIVTHEEDIAAHTHRIVRLRDGVVSNDEQQRTVKA